MRLFDRASRQLCPQWTFCFSQSGGGPSHLSTTSLAFKTPATWRFLAALFRLLPDRPEFRFPTATLSTSSHHRRANACRRAPKTSSFSSTPPLPCAPSGRLSWFGRSGLGSKIGGVVRVLLVAESDGADLVGGGVGVRCSECSAVQRRRRRLATSIAPCERRRQSRRPGLPSQRSVPGKLVPAPARP